jgi:formyl-CoA transferase
VKKEQFFREARSDLAGPMHGIRVIEATTAWAGPMVGCLLGDLGCDVVRIDLPGSDGGTGWPPHIPGTGTLLAHETVNRNKRSVSVDLRKPQGREVFLDLVRSADIIVENFNPGTLASWGVGYDDCRAVKVDIVYVSVSGWGQYGPWSDRAGYDPAALAAGGWMSLNGDPDGPPLKAPTYLADDVAGLHGALGALAALRHRDRTGEGQHVDVALLDALLFQSNGLLTAGATGLPLPRWGSQVGVSVPTSTYTCLDGFVFVALVLDAHWRKLAELMGRGELAEAPGFATNVQRVANREAVNAVVAEFCRTRSVAEALEELLGAGLAAARVNTYEEAANEPHVHARDMLQEMVLSDGSTAPLTGPAAKFSRTPTRVRAAAPRAGADTDEVLAEIGLDEEERQRLRKFGAI